MTPQQRMAATLAKAGIPHKEIKCFGSQVLVVCLGEDSARKFAALLGTFCRTVRGPVESVDYNKKNENTVLLPSRHKIWLVGGTI